MIVTRRDRPGCTDESGFSLLEALISLSLFLVVMAGVLSAYAPSRQVYVRGDRLADVQAHARLAMSEMSRQVRMAGWYPENFSATPPSPALTSAVRLATQNALAIHGDADNSGTSGVFFYCLDGTVLRRTSGAVGSSSSYSCSGADVIAENVSSLKFTYYDADDNPIANSSSASSYALDSQSPGSTPDLSDTTQRDAVRRVVITLTARREVPVNDFQEFTLTSNIALRNLN